MFFRIITYFLDLFLDLLIVQLFVNVLFSIGIYYYIVTKILKASDALDKTPDVFNRFSLKRVK